MWHHDAVAPSAAPRGRVPPPERHTPHRLPCALSPAPHSKGQRTVSQQLRRERILDVADLGALPKGRAVVLASGSRPTLVTTQPWMAGPHREAVEASIRAHDPLAERTIADAESERATVEAELATKERA